MAHFLVTSKDHTILYPKQTEKTELQVCLREISLVIFCEALSGGAATCPSLFHCLPEAIFGAVYQEDSFRMLSPKNSRHQHQSML